MKTAAFAVPPQVIDAMHATKVTLEGPTLEKFKVLLAQPQSSSNEFRSLLPPEGIVAMVAAVPQNIPQELPEAIRQTVAPLTEVVEKELPGLLSHNGFKLAVVESIQALRSPIVHNDSEQEDADLRLKTVVTVAADPMLIGKGEVVAPILRLVMVTNPAGENSEFFASSEDLSYLASAFAELLADMLETRSPLASKGVVKITSPSAIAQNFADLERALEKIRQFAPNFGVVLERLEEVGPPTNSTE